MTTEEWPKNEQEETPRLFSHLSAAFNDFCTFSLVSCVSGGQLPLCGYHLVSPEASLFALKLHHVLAFLSQPCPSLPCFFSVKTKEKQQNDKVLSFLPSPQNPCRFLGKEGRTQKKKTLGVVLSTFLSSEIRTFLSCMSRLKLT